MTDQEVKLSPEDYMGTKATARKSGRGVKFSKANFFADPADDPQPLGRETVDPDEWIARINAALANEYYTGARSLAMRYAFAVCKAVGHMEPPDSVWRERGYRYFQVTQYNWEQILEQYGFPVPEVPSPLSVEMRGGTSKSSGPDFIIHTAANAPAVAEGVKAAVIVHTDEAKLAEIARRRSELPPR